MPLLWLSLAFLGGIGLASAAGWPVWAWLSGAALSAALGVGVGLARRLGRLPASLRGALDWLWAQRQPEALPAALLWLLCAGCLGAARYQAAHPALDAGQVAAYNDRPETWVVQGVLAAPPDVRDGYTNLLLQVSQLRASSDPAFQPAAGLLLARLEHSVDWQYGDQVELRGALATPEAGETFSYRAYLAYRGVYSLMPLASARLLRPAQGFSLRRGLYRIQAAALALCYRLYPDPEASLVSGVLLGADRGLPPRVSQDFQASGISHILAISGFNITILAGVFMKIAEKSLGGWRGALAAGLGVAAYTLMTGAEASAVRAAWMGGLSLLAAQIGRRQDGLNSLGIVAGVMAWIEPDVLWDVGFQLSFAATLGLVILGGPMGDLARAWLQARLPAAAAALLGTWLAEYVALTLAAQVMTLPLMVVYFQRLSLVALLANLFVLPAQPALMIWSGVSVALGAAWQPLGQALAYLAWPLARYTILAAELFARIPGAQAATGGLPGWVVLSLYGAVGGLYLLRQRWLGLLGRLKPLLAPSLLLLALLAAVATAWRAAAQAPDGRLHLVMLDVNSGGNSGEALLVQSPGGRFVLINGGPSLNRLADGLGGRLPLTSRRLDWLVVAGQDDAQIEPLADLLPRYPPQQVLWAGETHATQTTRSLYAALQAAQIPIQQAAGGQTLDLGQGARLQVLWAGAQGAVLLLEWQKFRALLPVGVDEDGLAALQGGRVLGPVSALVLAHSGAAASNPADWSANLRPQAVLLSVSAQDRYGRPDPATLQAWQGFTLLRTDRNGWVEVSSDGEQMWVQAERK